MKTFFTLLLLIGIVFAAQAQSKINGSIKGRLSDTLNKESLAEATVSVLRMKDSSVAGFVLADWKGQFEIKDLDTGSYTLIASFQGFAEVRRRFDLTAEKNALDLGLIYMD